MEWQSKHIFYLNKEEIDNLVIYTSNIMEEFINKGIVSQYFFIRYWEGGPHIRLRYNLLNNIHLNIVEETLNNKIQLFFEKYPSNEWLTAEEYKKILDNSPDRTEYTDRRLRLANTIENINYNPEFGRYGGPNILQINESIFFISSRLAVKLLRDILVKDVIINKKFYIKKLIITLLVWKIIINELKIPYIDLKRISNETTKFWNERNIYSNKNINSLFNKILLNIEDSQKNIKNKYVSYFMEFLELLFIIKQQVDLEYFMSMLFSQLHMFTNRMGISPAEELSIMEFVFREDNNGKLFL